MRSFRLIIAVCVAASPLGGAQVLGQANKSFRAQAAFNVHKYSLTEGTTYRVSVHAHGFTPALNVLDKFGSIKGSTARRFGNKTTLVFTPKRTTEYKIFISPTFNSLLAKEKISYWLTIEKAKFKQYKEYKGELKLKFHPVKLESDHSYTVVATSRTFQPELRLLDGTKTMRNKIGRRRGRLEIASINFTPAENKKFRLLVTKPAYTNNPDAPLNYALEVIRLKPAAVIKGEWTRLDPTYKNRKGCFFKSYEYKLQEGQSYQFDLRSPRDNYLYLEDDKGKIVASDDGGAGLNAQLVFRPRRTGKYRLIVTPFRSGDTGSFRLTFLASDSKNKAVVYRAAGRVEDKTHWFPLLKGKTYRLLGQSDHFTPEARFLGEYGSIASRSAPVGETKTSVIYSPRRTEDSYLQLAPSAFGRIGESSAKYTMALQWAVFSIEHQKQYAFQWTSHAVALQAGVPYRIRATSNVFSPRLHYADQEEILESRMAKRRDGENQASLLVFPAKSATYRFFVDKQAYSVLPSNPPKYSLSVAPIRPLLDAKGKLAVTDPLRTGGYYFRVHEFKMTANRTYQITLVSDAFEPYLRLENSAKSRVGYETAHDERTSRMRFTPFRSGTYRIIATSLAAKRTGAYSVKVFDEG